MRAGSGHATNAIVTIGTGESARDAGSFADDWRALRGDGDIQFAPLSPPPTPEVPDWWLEVLQFLGRLFAPLADFFGTIGSFIGISGQVLMWGTIGLAAFLAVVLIWRYAPRIRLRAEEKGGETPDWSLDAGEAAALLEDADRLAAEGRYDEATHLLLRRSVGQIAAARPGLLEPSSTAREIAALPALSDNARHAFSVIAQRVERSLFALSTLSADDWHAARSAYADFALAIPRTA